MKLREILVDDRALDRENIEEGPLGSLAKAVGTGVGKAVGGVAKGVGAVAGGIAGIGSAVKKGFKAGKKTVAGDDEEDDVSSGTTATGPASANTAPTAATDKSAGSSGGSQATTPTAAPTTNQGTKPAATAAPTTNVGGTPPSTAGMPAIKPAAAKTPSAPGNDALIQAQKAVKSLDNTQKQEIVTMLQADPKVKAVMQQPTKPKAKPNTMANAPVSKTNVAKPTAQPVAAASSKKAPATSKMTTVKQKQLTPSGFGQMIQGLTPADK